MIQTIFIYPHIFCLLFNGILPYSPSVLLFLSYPFSFSFSITVLDVQPFPLQSSLYPRFPTHFSTFSSQGFIEKKI